MSANEWCDARQHHSTDSIHNNYTQVTQHIITFVNKRPKGFGKDCIECTPPSPHCGGSGPPSNTMFARSLRVLILNETSILSAVIEHQRRVKLLDRQTDRNIGSNRLIITDCICSAHLNFLTPCGFRDLEQTHSVSWPDVIKGD